MERPTQTATRQQPSQQSMVLNLKFKEDAPNAQNKENSKKNQNKTRKRVTWTEDTVDNEHMGKKKSNICCIYCPRRHTPEFDEQYVPTCSSDENNELERSNQSKREHLESCSKAKRVHQHS